jgi:hypothetical protein
VLDLLLTVSDAQGELLVSPSTADGVHITAADTAGLDLDVDICVVVRACPWHSGAIVPKLTIVTEGLQLVLNSARTAWSAIDFHRTLHTERNTHEALVELGECLRTIDLETLSFLGVRHYDM